MRAVKKRFSRTAGSWVAPLWMFTVNGQKPPALSLVDNGLQELGTELEIEILGELYKSL